jgi:hypothetical protein
VTEFGRAGGRPGAGIALRSGRSGRQPIAKTIATARWRLIFALALLSHKSENDSQTHYQ